MSADVKGPRDSMPDDPPGPPRRRFRRRAPERLPSGRHGLPRQFVVDSQRGRLFSAMAEAVAEKGYGATTVADVLKRAGVSRKTFYEQFSDKEDCFLAAYEAAVEQLVEQVTEAYGAASDWRAGVAGALAAFVRFIEAEPAFARMCVVEALAAGPLAIERRDRALLAFAAYVDSLRRERGDTSEIPGIAGRAIAGAIHEIVYTHIVRGRRGELQEALPELVRLTLRLYGGERRAVAARR